MRTFRYLALINSIVFATTICTGAYASDLSSITQQAQQAAQSGNTSRALGLYELSLSQSADQPQSVPGPIEGQYWGLITKTGDFPRALSFFTALNAQQKRPSATHLADRANAIGSYLGWLQQNKLFASVPPEFFHALNATAHKNYNQALTLDPDNFTALYGYAVYESYSPNGKPHMQELLAKLNALRSSHPHYPWEMVDYLEQHGHPQ